ncbi:hypothetical protein LTR09_005155 [Extremus antarcticus]|uniref:Aminoglycoside phosphotransferase domain-containing protein n=1 Tax=Extremus antarcticus TaxID=702011 RepID=A0AAJ0GCK1_9PEZI|nr:hypothetical protein LTR09_005155 [Extremus antarcticus]
MCSQLPAFGIIVVVGPSASMSGAITDTIRQIGLKWEEQWPVLVPVWTIKPNPMIIAELAAHYLTCKAEGKGVKITFLTGGSFNKIYDVHVEEDDIPRYIFRVSLPVDPFYKTESEVATLEYAKVHTLVPVPGVVAFDSSTENALGFEWILMEKVPGIRLQDAWPSMSQESKEALTTEVAGMMMSLQLSSFDSIGSLYSSDRAAPYSNTDGLGRKARAAEPETQMDPPYGQYVVGRLVDRNFFRAKRVFLEVKRGPYESCQDFIKASIDMEITSLEHLSDEPFRDDLTAVDNSIKESIEYPDDGDGSQVNQTINACRQLRDVVAHTFGDGASHRQEAVDKTLGVDLSQTNVRFVLAHTDLSARNILVDPKTHEITGVVDWEFSATQPLWRAAIYPRFLQSRACELEDLEDCDKTTLRERTEFYELTQLRKLYNRTFLEAGFCTPESLNRDRATRQKRKFLGLVNDVEHFGASSLEYFMRNADEEYWVTHERWDSGLFVADWPE